VEAEIALIPTKYREYVEQMIQKEIEKLNAELGWKLPLPTLSWEWFYNTAAETPGGVYFGLIAHMWSRMPTMAAKWEIRSLMTAAYDTNLNPLAWIGEWVAERNALVDPGYTRISIDPPEDVFYGIVPWAYQLIWRQLIWTWEPIWTHMTDISVKQMELDGHESAYATSKKAWMTLFGIDAKCPDVQERLANKTMALNLAVPAWLTFAMAWLLRLFLVLFAAIFICILWVEDIFFKIWVVIRDWFYYNIHLPIWNFFLWLHGVIEFIISIPYMMIELFLRFLWGIQMFIFKIMWDIMLPIFKFFFWLGMIIPKLVWEYIMVPTWWSEYESLGRRCYWDNLIPNYIYYGFSKPVLEWLLMVRW